MSSIMRAVRCLLARLFHPTFVWVRVCTIDGTVRMLGPMTHFSAELLIAHQVSTGQYRVPGKGGQRIVTARIVPVKP
jgi:hypothetical protein